MVQCGVGAHDDDGSGAGQGHALPTGDEISIGCSTDLPAGNTGERIPSQERGVERHEGIVLKDERACQVWLLPLVGRAGQSLAGQEPWPMPQRMRATVDEAPFLIVRGPGKPSSAKRGIAALRSSGNPWLGQPAAS